MPQVRLEGIEADLGLCFQDRRLHTAAGETIQGENSREGFCTQKRDQKREGCCVTRQEVKNQEVALASFRFGSAYSRGCRDLNLLQDGLPLPMARLRSHL
jgi:hypothetical protein